LKGNTKIVELLLEKGADVNAKDKDGNVTALIMAASNGHTETVKFLLERGADVNAKDNDGFTALKAARKAGHLDIVQLLKKAGAKE
jgi:ankyrin repeat protein